MRSFSFSLKSRFKQKNCMNIARHEYGGRGQGTSSFILDVIKKINGTAYDIRVKQYVYLMFGL